MTSLKKVKVKIEIKGYCQVYDTIEDEEDTGALIEWFILQRDLKVLVGEEDITESIGKPIRSNSVVKDHFVLSEQPPHYFKFVDAGRYKFEFEVECEKFNPKKLQLIKSIYEVKLAHNYIIPQRIVYDGVEYECNPDVLDTTNYHYSMLMTVKEEIPYKKK